VTHSPQVKPWGSCHWRVEKRQTKDATLSTVVEAVGADRIGEIARMLSGDRITDEGAPSRGALLPACDQPVTLPPPVINSVTALPGLNIQQILHG
jgi:DNA repair ATPase RecN